MSSEAAPLGGFIRVSWSVATREGPPSFLLECNAPMTAPKRPRLSVLIALSALSVLPLNLFVPSLPNLAREFDAEFALVNLSVAGYAVATAVTHLLAGALADRFGRKPVAMGALAIFTIASIGCALATDIVTFLLWRLLQAAVVAVYAVSLAAIRDTSDERTAARLIASVSSAWAIVPMLGPTAGGLLDTLWGWRSCFVAFAVFGCVGLWLTARHLNETNQHPSHPLARQAEGFRGLVQSVQFWAYALCMALSIGTLYVFLGGAPLVAAQLGPLSGVILGLCMGIVPAGFMLGSHMVARQSFRCAPQRVLLTGRAIAVLGLVIGLALWSWDVTHAAAFFGPCLCVGVGNGLTMPVANARILSLRPDVAGTAIGLAAGVTVAGAGAVAFLSGLVVSEHHAQGTVLGVMLASALLSFAAAAVAARYEQ